MRLALALIGTGFGLGVLTAGCASPPSAPTPAPDADTVNYVDPQATVFVAEYESLNPDVQVVTAENASKLVTIMQPTRKFSIVFGGADGCEADRGLGKGTMVANSDAGWRVDEGYALGWGWRPLVDTDRVTTGTDGTTVLVQIDKGTDLADSRDDIHRVYLINGGPVTVTPKAGTADMCNEEAELKNRAQILVDPWTYLECKQEPQASSLYCYKVYPPQSLNGENIQVRKLWRFVRATLRKASTSTLRGDIY